MMSVTMNERVFQCEHQIIAAKHWHRPQGIPTLAVHGWLDNAASFDKLAPYLHDLDILAIDLSGHGLSSHKPPGATLHLMDFIVDIIQVLNQCHWNEFIFMGHSLGAALGSLFAGSFPDRVKALLAIDALGPMSLPANHAPHQLALFIQDMHHFTTKEVRTYEQFDDAMRARMRVSEMKPSSCQALLKRGLTQIDSGEWMWRTDPRLRLPSAVQLTEEQVLAFLKQIRCPSLVIRPNPGFPFPEEIIAHRTQAIADLSLVRLPGYHHVHMDEPEKVSAPINTFLKEKKIIA